MPNFTRNAIKASFLKLLNQRPLNQITVKDIVEDCGVNRNSFYYHFQDIPTMLEEIVTQEVDYLIGRFPSISSLEECFEAAIRFTLDNKKAILHICNSVNRDIYERYLMKICTYVVTTYFDTAFGKDAVNENDRELMIHFTKCELFGLFVEWVNRGMPEDALEKLRYLLSLCAGLSDEMIRRCRENEKSGQGAP